MRVHFMGISDGLPKGPDPVAELDVLPRVGETVILPEGLGPTVPGVSHHPLGGSQTSKPCVVVVVG